MLNGKAEVWLDGERAVLTAGQSVVVPAGRRHGFRNAGPATLHARATLAAPIFEAWFDGETEVRRRWLPRSSPSSGSASREVSSS